MKRKIYKLWNKIRISKSFFPLPPIDLQEKYTETLRSFFKSNIDNSNTTLHKEWKDNGDELSRSILETNPIDFINWKTIRQTMFHVSKEVEFFEAIGSPFWKKYKHALRESKVGNPPAYNLYKESSGNLIHHFYNLLQVLEKFPFEIKNLNKVVEFGGAAEVTLGTADSKRVAGVVSTNPAHLMNGGLHGANVVAIALQGRVPCNVI
jgi:hypothetical protein